MFQDYLFPETIDAAVSMLRQYAGRARVISGGTDLILDAKKIQPKPEYYVDPLRIDALNGVYESDGFLVIGANTTHSQCACNKTIARHGMALVTASSRVGSTQIRNMGTLAGNVASANPAADAAVALTALEAVCVVCGPDGQREIPMTEMYRGVGRSAVDSSKELITQIKFPLRTDGTASAYESMELRKSLSLPMVCTAVKLQMDGDVIGRAVIVAAPLSPGPFRVRDAEEYLIGKSPVEAHFTQAGKIATECVDFRSSPTRGSSAYRHEVLPILIRRALLTAAASLH